VFYHNFLRAAVGEEEWKMFATRPTATPTEANPSPRMSTALNEAFALVLLKNNYFAWLLKAKQENEGLVTDYDSDRQESTRTLVDFLLGGVVIDLDEEKRDQHFVLMPVNESQADHAADALVLLAHRQATEHVRYTTQVLQASVRASVSYLQIHDALTLMKAQTAQQGINEMPERLRKRKKRQILKDLKPYTARKGSEKAFRGWSSRALFLDLFSYKKAIEEDYGLYAKFEQGYKHLYSMQHENNKNATTTTEENQPLMLLEDSTYEQMYDFGAVSGLS
jgi:hypothetical protein